MPKPTAQNCGNCQYFDTDLIRVLEGKKIVPRYVKTCHVKAPTSNGWPVPKLGEADWCGEWEAIKA